MIKISPLPKAKIALGTLFSAPEGVGGKGWGNLGHIYDIPRYYEIREVSSMWNPHPVISAPTSRMHHAATANQTRMIKPAAT